MFLYLPICYPKYNLIHHVAAIPITVSLILRLFIDVTFLLLLSIFCYRPEIHLTD